MSTNTGIAWTDATWNPVVGCEKVSQGCKFCYAKQLHDQRHRAHLVGHAVAVQYHVPFETIQLKPERLTHPLSWRKPRRVFVNSVSDLFHDDVPFEFIDQVFAVMALAQWHTFQVLTKRPERMRQYLRSHAAGGRHIWTAGQQIAMPRGMSKPPAGWPLPNVWLGVSVENQDAADERIPLLLETPAAIRFLSCEPLLGPVDISPWVTNLRSGRGDPQSIDWAIVGGESGPKHRPMELDWLTRIVSDCCASDVPVFVKQDSGIRSGKQGRIPNELWIQDFPANPVEIVQGVTQE